MKTLELITRTDIDGKGFWINFYKDGKKEDCKFYRTKEEANTVFDGALVNFEILGKEEVLRRREFNDAIRTVYISTDTGECFEKFPEDRTEPFFDIKTDATTELIERTVAMLRRVDDSVLGELKKAGFAASR